MPSGKRASMREGPLAALFRKTAQDTEESGEQRTPVPPAGSESAATPRVFGSGRGTAGTAAPASAAADAEVEVEEPRIPLPHERLRHAFSADIPENVLERPTRPEPAASEPDHDVYARVTRDEPVPERGPGGPVLRVVGVGGAGVNAINRMVEAEIEGVEFLAINTDLQSLQQSAAHDTLHIGDAITHGLGSGSTASAAPWSRTPSAAARSPPA